MDASGSRGFTRKSKSTTVQQVLHLFATMIQRPFVPMDRFIDAGNACRFGKEPILSGGILNAQPHFTGMT